jgi:hypothetical protein
MTFDWLDKFYQHSLKEPNYAEKTLAAYRLGMKAKGSIVGVVVYTTADCCEAASELPADKIYDPNAAPLLPLANCPQGPQCRCVYRPVMTYQREIS